MSSENELQGTPAGQGSAGLGRVQGWIAGVTGIVVLLPALLNGGFDIYAKVTMRPKDESERVSQALFKKYFNQAPVATMPVPITQNQNTAQVQLLIYSDGDVYMEFGKFSQWFPFPRGEQAALALSLMSSAYAAQAGVATGQGQGTYRQSERFEDGLLVRQRLWQNGVTEIKYIDPRTGEAEKTDVHRSTPAELAAPGQQAPVARAQQIAPIDLDALRKKAALPASASR